MPAERPNGPPILWPELHPVAVDSWLTANIGPQYVNYLPETLWAEIRAMTGQEPPEVVRNCIQALCLLRDPETDAVLSEWDSFHPTVLALDGNIPNFIALEPPSLETLFAGTDVVRHFRPDPLGPDVLRYCAGVAQWHGLLVLPPPFEGANPIIWSDGLRQRRLLERLSAGGTLQEDSPVDQQVLRLREAVRYRDARRQQQHEHLDLVAQEIRNAAR